MVNLDFKLKDLQIKNRIQCVPVIIIIQHLNSLIVLDEIKIYLGFGAVKFRNTNAAAYLYILKQ